MSRHRMTGSEYKKQYLVTGSEPRGRKGRKSIAPDTTDSFEEPAPEAPSIIVPHNYAKDDDDTKGDVMATRRKRSSVDDPSGESEPRVLSDSPYDMCQLKCNICEAPFKALRAHVQTNHQLNWRDFRRIYPEELYAVKTYHR
jgi:hypothetical protein